jgi:hypothetical protein
VIGPYHCQSRHNYRVRPSIWPFGDLKFPEMVRQGLAAGVNHRGFYFIIYSINTNRRASILEMRMINFVYWMVQQV